MVEDLRNASQEVHILPHHLVDFLAKVEDLPEPINLEFEIHNHCNDLKEGIRNSKKMVTIPDGHPLLQKYVKNFPYSFDVQGYDPGISRTTNENLFREFLLGDPDEEIFVELNPDKICEGCFIGIHCELGNERRSRRVSADNLYINNFYCWYRISSMIDDELGFSKNWNLETWMSDVKRIRKIFEANPPLFKIDQDGYPISIGMKRGLLVQNISVIRYYFFQTASLLLLWTNESKNLFTETYKGSNKDQILRLIATDDLLNDQVAEEWKKQKQANI